MRKAIERLTANYTSPKDGEPFYYLGVALKAQGKPDEAFDAFYKATWSEAWRGPAYYSLAEIATRRGDFSSALDYVNRSLDANALNIRALNLKTALFRHTNRKQEAIAVLNAAHEIDPLDVRAMAERWLATDKQEAGELTTTLRHWANTGLETATEYGDAGLWQDGVAILTLLTDRGHRAELVSYRSDPQFTGAVDATAGLVEDYYLGQFEERLGDLKGADVCRQLAMMAAPAPAFPFQWQAIHVLRHAMELNPKDAKAPYLLGNLLYDWQPEEATRVWEQSAALDPSNPIVHRNLAVAY